MAAAEIEVERGTLRLVDRGPKAAAARMSHLLAPHSGLVISGGDLVCGLTPRSYALHTGEKVIDAIAIQSTGTGSLTYAELNARANRLARHLRGLGAGPDVLIGLSVERSLDMLVALLAESGISDLRTFSVGFEDHPDEKGSEFEYSDQVVERFDTDHHKIHVPNSEVLRRLAQLVMSELRGADLPYVLVGAHSFRLERRDEDPVSSESALTAGEPTISLPLRRGRTPVGTLHLEIVGDAPVGQDLEVLKWASRIFSRGLGCAARLADGNEDGTRVIDARAAGDLDEDVAAGQVHARPFFQDRRQQRHPYPLFRRSDCMQKRR